MVKLFTFFIAALLTTPVHADTSNVLFKKISPLIFRIKTALAADAPKASYGSAFVVDTSGLLITNYHVVSDVVQKSIGYKNFVMIGEKAYQAKILGLDIVHDLAIIKIDHPFPSKISLVPKDPSQGEHIYSFGIPMDLNMSIVNGLFNGFRKVGPFDQMQMSNPINSGMSGGPTTNGDGQLVGVNVSLISGANSLTFAVPWRYVRDLIQEAKVRPFASEEPALFHARIEEQLTKAQDEIMDKSLREIKKTTMGSWSFLEVPALFKCWMTKRQEDIKAESRKADLTERSCGLEQDVYLMNSEHTLDFTTRVAELKNLKLNSFQFGSLAHTVINGSKMVMTEGPDVEEEERLMGASVCDELPFWNQKGIPFMISFCARSYTHYPHLFETVFKFAVLDKQGQNSLIGRIRLDGFTSSNSKKFIREFMENVATQN